MSVSMPYERGGIGPHNPLLKYSNLICPGVSEEKLRRLKAEQFSRKYSWNIPVTFSVTRDSGIA